VEGASWLLSPFLPRQRVPDHPWLLLGQSQEASQSLPGLTSEWLLSFWSQLFDTLAGGSGSADSTVSDSTVHIALFDPLKGGACPPLPSSGSLHDPLRLSVGQGGGVPLQAPSQPAQCFSTSSCTSLPWGSAQAVWQGLRGGKLNEGGVQGGCELSVGVVDFRGGRESGGWGLRVAVVPGRGWLPGVGSMQGLVQGEGRLVLRDPVDASGAPLVRLEGWAGRGVPAALLVAAHQLSATRSAPTLLACAGCTLTLRLPPQLAEAVRPRRPSGGERLLTSAGAHGCATVTFSEGSFPEASWEGADKPPCPGRVKFWHWNLLSARE